MLILTVGKAFSRSHSTITHVVFHLLLIQIFLNKARRACIIFPVSIFIRQLLGKVLYLLERSQLWLAVVRLLEAAAGPAEIRLLVVAAFIPLDVLV